MSCGGAITSGFEEPVDLSELADDFRISLLFTPAVYERFFAPTMTSPGSPNDLSFKTLRFAPTTPYSDKWAERNDTLKKATRISRPFDSIPVHRFTGIGTDGDVDFYRFTAHKGEVIVAEILSSQLDTVLAIYERRTGEQLAVDTTAASACCHESRSPSQRTANTRSRCRRGPISTSRACRPAAAATC